jgi:protein O-GlcNAc transferase
MSEGPAPSSTPSRADAGQASFDKALEAHRAQRLDEAERLYGEALAADPGHVRARHNLGAVYLQRKQVQEALPHLALAAGQGAGTENWVTYGLALVEAGQFKQAEDLLTDRQSRGGQSQGGDSPRVTALALRLNHAWGLSLIAEGRCDAAEARLRRALEAAPADPRVHSDLGAALVLQKSRAADAEVVLRQALALDPGQVEALTNLGVAVRKLEREAEAEAAFRQALKLDPENTGALRNLGNLLKGHDRIEEAKACYLAASRIDGTLSAAMQVHLMVSTFPMSWEQIRQERSGYQDNLARFRSSPLAYRFDTEPNNLPWFPLSYHGLNDRALLQQTSDVLREKNPGLNYHSPRLRDWRPPTGRRIKVAFISQFFHDHVVGKLNRGFIENLDRSRFEVAVVHLRDSKPDAFRAELDRAADASMTLGASLDDQRRQMEALAPDVAFFADIGMSGGSYYLAHSRLAPVQATSWGHPNTTGVDTMDYFVSAASLEPDDGPDAYVERLALLSRLPTCYPAPSLGDTSLSRADLGLPTTGVLYGCPQSLFKIHPEFDRVLADIAQGDPDGHIVLLDPAKPHWTEILTARWRAQQPALLERIRFLPRMPTDRFVAHLGQIDVLLDPIHFGSGNTLFEPMLHGTPIVTWPGGFARGRIVAAAYRQMAIEDAPVAERLEDYAPLALALGKDPARRARLRAALRDAAQTELFSDVQAVRDFETFLEAAVAAAGRGERLASGWRTDQAAA